ncbi:MAG: VanZ family protein [Bacteroidota bacterium]|nr:VanZ family protein [Bacteroidota bacterium]
MIVFKGSLFFQYVPTSDYYQSHSQDGTYTGHNFVPFSTITFYLTDEVSRRASAYNLAGNVLLFIPMGIFLPLVFRSISTSRLLFLSVLFSLLLEAIQLVARRGQFDIDDVILNATGSMVGYAAFLLFREWSPLGLGKQKRLAGKTLH